MAMKSSYTTPWDTIPATTDKGQHSAPIDRPELTSNWISLTGQGNNLTKAQTMTVAAIEERLPDLVEARDFVESFHEMLRRKSNDDLDMWIDRAAGSLVASFANGVIREPSRGPERNHFKLVERPD